MFSNKTQSRKHKMSHVKMNIFLSLQNHVYCCKLTIFNLNNIWRRGKYYIYPVKSMRYASTLLQSNISKPLQLLQHFCAANERGQRVYLRWIPGNEIQYVFLNTVSTERQMSIYKAT